MERLKIIVGVCICLLTSFVAAAEDLAKLNQDTQNPVANLTVVPFQNNWTFKVGPNKEIAYVMNFQPVIPYAMTNDLNLITRIVLPVISQPRLAPGPIPGVQGAFGLADTDVTFFLSPRSPGKFIWGIGPVFTVPTSTRISLGSNQWGIGPSIVVLTQQGLWTAGVLANQVWSLGGSHVMPPVSLAQAYSQTLIQPFISYSFLTVWSVSFVSETTCNWLAASGHRWTVPLDLVVAKIVTLRKQSISIGAGARYFATNAGNAPVWGVRFVVSFLFPNS